MDLLKTRATPEKFTLKLFKFDISFLPLKSKESAQEGSVQ